MNDLRQEFEKHMNSRACEKPTKEMLFELFNEGYKLGLRGVLESEQKASPDIEYGGGLDSNFNSDPVLPSKKPWKK